ncbi:MAG: class I SAM-dependent RNA methyltransferase [Deltaproteobacteria bacterium]|nr:class I SAM-dependent RNA methyltransferase [Deltaproteobacteria bacterium]
MNTGDNNLELFAVVAPGLEEIVAGELNQLNLEKIKRLPGGVSFSGDFGSLMQANLWLRCATRVLLRVARFPVFHLAQLDKRAHRVDWAKYLSADLRVKVSASCRRSRIYHSGAACERVMKAIADVTGCSDDKNGCGRHQTVQVRIEKDVCVISLDSSGDPLYQRGLKPEVTAAPIRETLAAAILKMCGYDGSQALLDPMCGSGTFVMEAAALAHGLAPGLRRSFAFMDWPGFDKAAWKRQLERCKSISHSSRSVGLFASDGNAGAIGKTKRNLKLAGLAESVLVERCLISDLQPPARTGLLVCNPPYGKRLRDNRNLNLLYAELGSVFRKQFSGWQFGMITTQHHLADATGLKFNKVSDRIPHGGLKIRLYQAG